MNQYFYSQIIRSIANAIILLFLQLKFTKNKQVFVLIFFLLLIIYHDENERSAAWFTHGSIFQHTTKAGRQTN